MSATLALGILRKLAASWRPQDPFVAAGELRLPPASMRQCTAEFKDDGYFLASAEGDVRKLAARCGLAAGIRILDIGCGSGRLPIGLLAAGQPFARYQGLDVDKEAIDWCRRWISGDHPAFRFTHIDVHNERYNPKARVHLDERFRFDLPSSGFDLIYLYSVFTHMEIDDILVYLREMKRLLAPAGRVFLTAYLEEGVPEVTVDPPGYREQSAGPLHRVRLDRDYFDSLLAHAGLRMFRFDHEGENDRQSAAYLMHCE